MTREEAIAYGKECLSWNRFSKNMAMYQFIDMAIKALEREPRGDAISREAVHDEIEEWWLSGDSDGRDLVKRLHGRIDNIPSANPQESKWIPVSERLPDIRNYESYYESYLVTLKRGSIQVALFTECNGKYWWTYNDVVAWMPLPKPYEPQESEG